MTKKFGKIDFTNTSDEFGDYLGKYVINGKDVFALPYPPIIPELINKVILLVKLVFSTILLDIIYKTRPRV